MEFFWFIAGFLMALVMAILVDNRMLDECRETHNIYHCEKVHAYWKPKEGEE